MAGATGLVGLVVPALGTLAGAGLLVLLAGAGLLVLRSRLPPRDACAAPRQAPSE
jgi:hypothetical protein